MANEGNLVPFKPGYAPRRNTEGRPRKLVTLMKEIGYTQSEVNDTIKVITAMKFDELGDLYKNPDATMLERILAATYRKALERGSLHNVEMALTRVFGKPKEQSEVTVTNNTPPVLNIQVIDTGVPVAESEKDVQI